MSRGRRRPQAVSAAEAMRLVAESGALIVDVRRQQDWARTHVPGAVHMPLHELESRAEELPDDRPLIAFCTAGLLSSGAADLLVRLGLDGRTMNWGLMGWRAAGGPLVGRGETEVR